MIDHPGNPDSRRCERRSSKYRWDSRRRSCATAKRDEVHHRARGKGGNEAECASVRLRDRALAPGENRVLRLRSESGRLLAAIGNAGVRDLEVGRVDLYLDEVLVSKGGGRAPSYREEDGKRVMAKSEITVRVVLKPRACGDHAVDLRSVARLRYYQRRIQDLRRADVRTRPADQARRNAA